MTSRIDTHRIETEITPLLLASGVELVAIEWHQGPGHGILRIFIDRPNGDPRNNDPALAVGLEAVTQVTRDVSAAMDALDLVEGSYTLEIGSPGPQRPVQRREDFERFAGLPARLEVRGDARERHSLRGTLRGLAPLADDRYAVLLDVAGTVHALEREKITRARLDEVAPVVIRKVGKGPSRRQERLAARDQSRAIEAAHRASRAGGRSVSKSDAPESERSAVTATEASHEAKR